LAGGGEAGGAGDLVASGGYGEDFFNESLLAVGKNNSATDFGAFELAG